jgi:hypothetical protein
MANTDEVRDDGLPLEEEPFLKDVDPNVLAGDQLVVLRGYLGRGVNRGEWRLYRCLQLDEFYVLREEDVVARSRIDGVTHLWVKNEARISLVRGSTALDFENEILAGPIGCMRSEADPCDGGWLARPEDQPLLSRAVMRSARSRKSTLSQCH